VSGIHKQYIAIFDTPQEVKSLKISAYNLTEAKKYAKHIKNSQAFLKNAKVKVRTAK
jgi:hypothetical protein